MAAREDAAAVRETATLQTMPTWPTSLRTSAGLDVPDADRRVGAIPPVAGVPPTAGGVGQPPVGREGHAEDPLGMAPELPDQPARVRSRSRSTPSSPPDRARRPSGEIATELIHPPCSRKRRSICASSRPQRMIVPSTEPESKSRPSGEAATAVTGASWPWSLAASTSLRRSAVRPTQHRGSSPASEYVTTADTTASVRRARRVPRGVDGLLAHTTTESAAADGCIIPGPAVLADTLRHWLPVRRSRHVLSDSVHLRSGPAPGSEQREVGGARLGCRGRRCAHGDPPVTLDPVRPETTPPGPLG